MKDIDKYITIGQYKGLSLEKVVETITDAEVEGSISQDLAMTKEEVKDGVVEEGDTVVVNYVGTENGKEFNGGSAENQEITIGSGGYIPGFEDGILGMKKERQKMFPLLSRRIILSRPWPEKMWYLKLPCSPLRELRN